MSIHVQRPDGHVLTWEEKEELYQRASFLRFQGGVFRITCGDYPIGKDTHYISASTIAGRLGNKMRSQARFFLINSEIDRMRKEKNK